MVNAGAPAGGMPEDRCRLVLISPAGDDGQAATAKIREVLGAGDIASMILWQSEMGEEEFAAMCDTVVPVGQAAGVAMIVAGDSRIAGRCGADGVHVEDRDELARLARPGRDRIVGTGGVRTRHEALELGELFPDYILFGRFGRDQEPEPHPHDLALAGWWASLVEIPCILLAGREIGSIRTAAATGAEFVAASSAIFDGPSPPAQALGIASAMLAEAAEAGEPDR